MREPGGPGRIDHLKMEIGESPRKVSSRRRIRYRPSAWRVHQFEVWSGALVCRAAALRMAGSLLLWVGGGDAPALGEAALGVPEPEAGAGAGAGGGGGGGRGLATTLLAGGGEGAASALARRLAAALARPVYVCCGATFDRLALPLVERGLIAEIRALPHLF